MTLSWGMLARALMISSVMPSQKNSFSPLVLLFTKGRTAIEVLVCMDWSNGPKMRCFVELWCVVVLGSLGLGDPIRCALWRWHLSLSRERVLLSLAAKDFVGGTYKTIPTVIVRKFVFDPIRCAPWRWRLFLSRERVLLSLTMKEIQHGITLL